MNEFNFIHVSDVHLGHQQFNLEERFADFGKAFAEVVNYALKQKVDMVIIGGDFFHKRAINAETLKQAIELLQPLKNAGITVISVEGNHDKAYYQDKSSWLKLLNSLGYLRLLKPIYTDGKIKVSDWSPETEGCLNTISGVKLIGLGYLGATSEQRLTELAEQLEKDNNYTILILHAAVNKLLAQDLGGIKKEILDLLRDKVDYLALGHIHSRDEDGWYFNPGALENCHIDEAKEGREKGFYHVTVTGKQKTVTYITSKPRDTRLLTVDISNAGDPEEVNRRVWQVIKEADLNSLTKPMVQILLKGDIDFSSLAIDTGALAKTIKETADCLYVEVQNNANLPMSDSNLNDENAINRPEIEKQVLSRLLTMRYPMYKNYSNEFVSMILQVKAAALSGENPQDILSRIANAAEGLPELMLKTTGQVEVAAEGEDTLVDQKA